MKSLLTKAGEQGLLAVAFPEEYGGLGKDFVTATIVNEYLGLNRDRHAAGGSAPAIADRRDKRGRDAQRADD